MSKRIVISGYYGFDNQGDEAVLQSIIQALRNVEPDVEIMVLSANPKQTAAKYGVLAKGRWKLPKVLAALYWGDMLISGGGSLLQDVTSQKTIPYYLGVVGLARALRKPVAFYAQGVGPIDQSVGRYLTRLIGNRVQLITVRDEDSCQLLKEIGVNRPPMEVTVDPVVCLQPTPPKTKEYKDILELKENAQLSERPIIGIAPRSWQNLEGFKDALVETARRLQQEKGAEILFIPMHIPHDLELCKELAAQLEGVHIISGEYLPAELLSIYQQLDFLIGIRLHALIFAAAVHVPHLGITYDPKIDGFLKRLEDQPIAKIEEVTADHLYMETVQRFNHIKAERARVVERITSLQEIARANAQMVINLLN